MNTLNIPFIKTYKLDTIDISTIESGQTRDLNLRDLNALLKIFLLNVHRTQIVKTQLDFNFLNCSDLNPFHSRDEYSSQKIFTRNSLSINNNSSYSHDNDPLGNPFISLWVV